MMLTHRLTSFHRISCFRIYGLNPFDLLAILSENFSAIVLVNALLSLAVAFRAPDSSVSLEESEGL